MERCSLFFTHLSPISTNELKEKIHLPTSQPYAILFVHQYSDKFIQTLIVPQRFHNASEFQGISAIDFSFDENQIRSVMLMIVTDKIIFSLLLRKQLCYT